MRKYFIQEPHDLECAMGNILARTAERAIAENGHNYVPGTLFSDFAIDIRVISNHAGEKFLWHVHDAGTYLHMLDRNYVEREQPSFLSWRERFLKFDDWTFTELNYRWGSENNPLDRIFYYDGGRFFREVSRETALLIWQFTGLELIRQHENALMEETA